MNQENQLLFFFSTLGVFNGLLLSTYFIVFVKTNRISNFFFGLLLLMLSLRIGKSVFYYFDSEVPKIILQIGLSACFLIGPSLFFYFKTKFSETKKLTFGEKVHFLALVSIILIIGSFFSYPSYPNFWNTYLIKIIYFQWFIYLLISGYLIRKKIKNVFISKKDVHVIDWWIIGVFIGNTIIFFMYVSVFFTRFSGQYILGALSFSIIFYFLLIFLVLKKKREAVFSDPKLKYGSKKIDEDEANILIEKLELLMTKDKLYINSDIKLNDIAKELKILPHTLSQLLNDNIGKSFSSYINEYRVSEAKRLLISNDDFTLESIGYDAGFSSKSAFFSIFKKFTKTTPAGYKKSVS